MASTKITELTAASTIAVSDVLPFVSDPSGSPTTKKITANNLANSILSNTQTSVVPSANVLYNLGSSTRYWNNVYVRALYANGSLGSNGKVLSSNGTITFWSDPTYIATNVNAGYTWTNNHTFSGGVTFTGSVTVSTTPPANSTSTGSAGQIAWDSNSIYICVGTNSWKKAALSNF